MDTPTFNACYEATRSPLLAYLTRVSGNPALAEDLMQEAYVRLLCHPPADTQPQFLRSWLFTTSTRLLRDYWRENQRWKLLPWSTDAGDVVPAWEPVSLDASPERRLLEQQLVSIGFTALSPRQRCLLWLCHVEGFEHAEAARTLGLSSKSIKVLLHRARQRMNQALTELELTFKGGPA